MKDLKKYLVIAALGMIIVLSACSQDEEDTADNQNVNEQQPSGVTGESIAADDFFEPFDGKIDHIHGLGYAGDQGVPFFAAHDGLKVYENGKWYKTKKENNDYMGFNVTADGFYTSGHPGTDSQLPNPFGIKKSTDNGQTLENLALEGEVDFHLMGVGYEEPTIFVMNPQKSATMEADKFYVSENDAENWKEAAANGLEDDLLSISVHPEDGNIIAAAGQNGIYLSYDQGENFELITSGMQGTAVFFTKDALIYGAYDGNPSLIRHPLSDKSEEEIPLPEMDQDGVLYFAQHPKDEKEMTFTSFNGNIYQTKDNAENWDLLVETGEIK
ncbi:F510_1955 family glycosylhydrolase [Jeotgalibacillus marinus]|uniref:F510_1955 family glycosylhydrolase n=1 Tax=Jeotgalibacillus marinus TaxID=86667 RepID=A0ABV3Q8R1_9BACL